MAAKIWSARSLLAWATSARAVLPNFSKPRLSSRHRSRPKENSSKPFKASEWEPVDALTLQRFNAIPPCPIAELFSLVSAQSRRLATTSRRFGPILKTESAAFVQSMLSMPPVTIAKSGDKSAVSILNDSSKIRRTSAVPIDLHNFRWPQPKWRWRTVGLISKTSNRSEEHTSELQSRFDLVCRLLLEKKKS